MYRLNYLVNLVVVSLMLLAVTINKDGKVLGAEVTELMNPTEKVEVQVETLVGDTLVVNSTSLAPKVLGYGGPTPLKLFLKDGKIVKVELLENSETEDFLDYAIEKGLLHKWDGLTPLDAQSLEVDAISGSTFSSEAIIANVKAASAYVSKKKVSDSGSNIFTLKNIAALLVVLFGVVLTFMPKKSKRLRIVQLVLNVAVVGFWSGSFISLLQLTSWFSNGVNLAKSLVPFTLLLVAIILPFASKKGAYCASFCPMGSLQELVGKCNKRKISIPPAILKYLNKLREVVLLLLLFFMWIGVGFNILNYEIFTFFMFQQASTAVMVMAITFLVLSLFIQKPYCRFICPTGALLTLSQRKGDF